MRARGFTLVELVVVIVITGILAATLTVFLKPVIDGYFDTRRRADLTDMADTALRRMAKDIRSAVPNSVRTVTIPPSPVPTCFQLVPTIAGGRYRMASDTVNDTAPLPCTPGANCSAPLDVTRATTDPTTTFDVLSPLASTPAANDWVVIDNQNAGDVYAGSNRAQISAVPTTPRATDGLSRITVASTPFPSGYDGGRFVIVPDAEKTVFYSCVGNKLYRTVAAFDANQETTCALTTGAVVASDVVDCTFVYDPNQGATQQSGFLWMRLELGRAGSGENFALNHGVHVDNVP